MKFPGIQRIVRGVAIALTVSVTTGVSFAVLLDNGFKETGPGDFDFENPANWHAGVVDGVFAHIPSGVQNIVFNAASPNPANGLTFRLGGVSPTLTLRGAGASGQTLTLLGDVRVLGGNGAAITIGAMATNKILNLELADDRTFRVEATNTLTIVNSILDNQDGYGITKAGGGRLVLVGAADFGGGTQIVEGTLEVAGENALPVGGEVSVNGGATLAVAANQTLGGIWGEGSVEIGGGLQLKLFTAQDICFDGTISGQGSLRFYGDEGGTLALKGANTYEGGTWIEAGTVYALNSSGSATGTGMVTIASGAKLQVGRAGMGGAIAGDIAVSSGGEVVFATGPANPRAYAGVISGAGQLMVEADTKLTLTGLNTYSGETRVQPGSTLVAGALNALSPNSVVYLDAGDYSGVLQVNFDATIAGLQSGDGYAAGLVEISGPAALTLNVGEEKTFEYEGTITSVDGRLIKAGSGTQILSGASEDFEGALEVEAGAVYLDAQFALGTSADVSIGGGATVLLRADQTFATLSGGPGAEVVFAEDEMPAFVPTLRVLTIAGNEDSIFGGSISGYGKLVKSGAGTLTLTDESDYSGGTWVSAGKLVVANFSGSATGAGAVTVDVGAELQIGNGSSGMGGVEGTIANHGVVTFNQLLGTYAGGITGTGQVRIAPWSSVTFDGAHGYIGGTTVEENARLVLNRASGNTLATSGDVTLRDGSALEVNFDQTVRGVISASTTSGIKIAGGKTLTVNSPTGASELFAGTILGVGGLEKNGPGTLVLSGASTYGGGTRIRGGVLFANNVSGSATGTGLVEVLNGGILAGTGTILGAVQVDLGGVIAPAAGLGMPGKLTVGSTTLGGGGEFAFQIADADGGAGTDYSLLAISGQLAIASTATQRFAIQMYSVGLDGGVANFDPAQAYSWMFVTTTGGIAGFDPAKFEFNLEDFSVALTGSFSVSQLGDNLLINYSPAAIPEPSTWMLLGGGLAVVVLMVRGKRKGR